MARIQKFESQAIELMCSADKFYDVYRNNMHLLVEFCPEIYKSVEILEGDGKSVGTVRLWELLHGDVILSTREKLKAVDDENRSITFSSIEGVLLNPYKRLDFNLSVIPNGSGATVKWSAEYEKKNADSRSPDEVIELLSDVAIELEIHLLLLSDIAIKLEIHLIDD